MKKKLYYLLPILLCITNTVFAQYEVEEDDPIINGYYVGFNMGYHSKSAATMGVDARSYFLNGLINIDARLQVKGPITKVFDIASAYDESVQLAAQSPTAHPFAHPKDGLKSGYDFEVGGCYNFFRRKRTRAKAITLFSSGRTTFYAVRDVTMIRMYGVRLGAGSYRGTFNGMINGLTSKYFTTTPDIKSNSLADDYAKVFTNFTGQYLYLGAQTTGIMNVKLSDLWFGRKIENTDYYFDFLIPIGKSMKDVRMNSESTTYSIKAKDKTIANGMGARIGVNTRTARYASLCYGLEVGFMPGYRIPGTGNFSPGDEFEITDKAYINGHISINISAPVSQANFDDFKE